MMCMSNLLDCGHIMRLLSILHDDEDRLEAAVVT